MAWMSFGSHYPVCRLGFHSRSLSNLDRLSGELLVVRKRQGKTPDVHANAALIQSPLGV